MKEQLPCTLRINAHVAAQPRSMAHNSTTMQYGATISRSNGKQSAPPVTTINKKMSLYTLNGQTSNIYNTYGRSCFDLTTLEPTDDLMVDVDLDPTYHKVLNTFRKAMAHCN